MVEVYKKCYVYHELDVEMIGIMLYCFGILQKMRRDCLCSVTIYALLMCDSCLQAINKLLEYSRYIVLNLVFDTHLH